MNLECSKQAHLSAPLMQELQTQLSVFESKTKKAGYLRCYQPLKLHQMVYICENI